MPRASRILPFLFVLVHPVALSQSSDTGSVFRWFPSERIFPKLFADGMAEQMSLGKDMQTRRWIGSIGGVQRVVEWTPDSLVIQAGVGSTVYVSLIRQPGMLQVMTADFYVDFPVDIRLTRRFVLRTGWGHHSAHLVDDGIEVLQLHSINYAKDYIPLLFGAWLPEIDGFAYGGGRIDYYTIPERSAHGILQGGIQASVHAFGSGPELYAAIDLKAISEASWGTTQSYQLGMTALRSGTSALRLAYTFRTGIDDRGQFYRQHTDISSMGLYFDF